MCCGRLAIEAGRSLAATQAFFIAMSRQKHTTTIASSMLGFLLAVIAICDVDAEDEDAKEAQETSHLTSNVYSDDEQHLWNRLHRTIFVRSGRDRRKYGLDRVDPLLWRESTHLLKRRSHQQVIELLDQLLETEQAPDMSDPLARAMMQRDLWAVFDWSAKAVDASRGSRQQLQRRLAMAIRQLALTGEHIQELPDTYAAIVSAGHFAQQFDPQHPQEPFLPPDLFSSDGPWICVGREDGPVAIRHVAEDLSRSVFLVFLGLPGGRQATLDYWQRVTESSAKSLPQFPVGTQTALIRLAMLIDADDRIVPTRLVETVQLRVERSEENPGGASFFEFQLSRTSLLAEGSGLRAVEPSERDFRTGFMTHGVDPIERDSNAGFVMRSCVQCHREPGGRSFNSLRFGESDGRVLLKQTSPDEIVQSHLGVKQERPDWRLLQRFWND